MLLTEQDMAPLRIAHAFGQYLPYRNPDISSALPPRLRGAPHLERFVAGWNRNSWFDSKITIPSHFFTWSDEIFPILQGDLRDIVLSLVFMKQIPILTPLRNWYGLHHQAGGGANEQYEFVGTPLTPKRSIEPALQELARRHEPQGAAGWDGQHFDSASIDTMPEVLEAYRAEVQNIGLSYTGTWLTESMYPLDVTARNLSILTDECSDLRDFGLYTGEDIEATKALFLVLCKNSD
jgi:hypothetical protein